MGRRYETDDIEPFSGQPTRRLRPSSRLAPRAKAIFTRVVSNVAANHFRPADQEPLERYCEAQALAEMAAARLFAIKEDAGPVDKNGKLSAWFQVHTVASRTANSLASRLRLTVSARSPKAVKTTAAPLSYYERMTLEEDGSDDYDGVDGDRR
jgi:phage terminase small subunit